MLPIFLTFGNLISGLISLVSNSLILTSYQQQQQVSIFLKGIGHLDTNILLERDITLSMLKEIGKMQQFKQKKRGGNSKNNEETQSNVILRFKPSKLNETQISATFKDADENKVKEFINIFQQGDPNKNLVTLFKQVIDLGNLYDLWRCSFKTLCQVLARSLSGKPQEKWNASIKECMRNHCEEFIKMCQTAKPKFWARMLSETKRKRWKT